MASEDVREVVPEIVATMSNATYKGEKGTFNDLTPEQKESLRGPRGYQGPQGDTGPKGATGPQGEQGPAGADGEDGITPDITVSNITGGHTISISYGVEDPRNSSFNVMDGADGSNGSAGQNGSDGITPIITATTIAGGHNISISYGTDDPRNTNFDVLDGQDGAAGADGQDGVDGTPGADGPAGADGADGITPDITVTSITGGHTVTIDYGSGDSRNTSFNVMDGATGATGPAGTYTAGTGISISNGQISLSSNPVPAISNGDAGKVLAVNSGETGVEWATPASGGSSYTAGRGIEIDQNNVINCIAQNPLIHSMLQMTSAGNDFPGVTALTSSSTWDDFLNNIKAGKIVYITGSTSYTFNDSYKLTAALLGITTLWALNIDAVSLAMMSPTVSAFPSTGTQIYYSTYYYFDGNFLWSWKKPENLGNFIKVHYRNSNNVALGYALKQITDSIDGIATLPSDPSNDGTYVLTNTVASGSATQSWEAASSGGGSSYTAGDGISISSGGVISRNPITPSEAIMLTVPGTDLASSGNGGTAWSWGDNLENYHVTTIQELADMLSKNGMALLDGASFYSGITPRIVNSAAGTNWTFWTRTVSSYNGAVTSSTINADAEMGQRWSYVLFIRFGNAVLKTWVDEIKNLLAYYRLQQTWAPPSQYNNYSKLGGKYHAQLETAITGLDYNLGQVKTRCPDLPRVDGSYVDGTYTLQVTVSSGTPTYSWVANT